jgi:hypothetical protein
MATEYAAKMKTVVDLLENVIEEPRKGRHAPYPSVLNRAHAGSFV